MSRSVFDRAVLHGRVSLRVLGDSMAPLIREGDLLEVDLGSRELSIGDLVVFRCAGQTVVHRVVAVHRPPTDVTTRPAQLITKADRLWWCDPPITSEQVLGKVRAVLSGQARLRLDTKQSERLARAVARLSHMGAASMKRLGRFRRRLLGTEDHLSVRLVRAIVRRLLMLPARFLLYSWAACALLAHLSRGRRG